MSSQSAPRNRKERRAAAKEGRTADSIPMAQPDRTRPKGRTLFELAAEKEAALRGRSSPAFSGAAGGDNGEPSVVTINPDGTLSGPDGEPLSPSLSAKIKASMESGNEGGEDEKVERDSAPFAESVLYTLTLCMLHFTFSVLVAHQYGMTQELPWSGMGWQTLSAAPAIGAVVFILHPRASAAWAQVLFLAMSIAAGCWIIYASTNMPYMAVMRNAPGAGTIWIWSALESRTEVAITGVVAVGAYFWYGGFTVFN